MPVKNIYNIDVALCWFVKNDEMHIGLLKYIEFFYKIQYNIISFLCILEVLAITIEVTFYQILTLGGNAMRGIDTLTYKI